MGTIIDNFWQRNFLAEPITYFSLFSLKYRTLFLSNWRKLFGCFKKRKKIQFLLKEFFAFLSFEV